MFTMQFEWLFQGQLKKFLRGTKSWGVQSQVAVLAHIEQMLVLVNGKANKSSPYMYTFSWAMKLENNIIKRAAPCSYSTVFLSSKAGRENMIHR